VLDGGFTDCCILNTSFDAGNRLYRVIVARDLVCGTNTDMEDAAIKIISLHLGLVMDSVDVLNVWSAADLPAKSASH
jgi:biuret amidohydrolase